MSKFNQSGATAGRTGQGPVRTLAASDGPTYEGGPGFGRDAKSELFLLAVSNMVSEDSFYERAAERDSRFVALVREVAVDEDWTARFVRWLRREANMRSASLVLALEAVRFRIEAGLHGGNRSIVRAAIARADEPGEALAYWTSKFGRTIPKPVKRGIADAAGDLYWERSLLKYDTDSHAFRFADVIDLVHPEPTGPQQSAIFKYALDRRHDHVNYEVMDAELLPTIAARARWKQESDKRALLRRDPDVVQRAALTWESLSGDIEGGMDAEAWEAILPHMGYMALIRNLRNFEQAGVSEAVLQMVAARIADPEEVAKSRQLPMRFLSAYQATKGSLRFAYPIEQALQASLVNVPKLGGRTLILVDRSNSMFWDNLSARSDLTRADAAALFGTVMALRAENATLVQYGGHNANGIDSEQVHFNSGDSVLPTVEKFRNMNGTETQKAVRKWFDDHNRVVILTDEQAHGYYGEAVGAEEVGAGLPANVPLYTWNLAGYKRGHAPGGPNRHTFGGLSDKGFELIPLIEAGQNADWPF